VNDKFEPGAEPRRGDPGTPKPIPLKLLRIKRVRMHQACTAHKADRTMNVLNELRIT